MPVRYGSLPFQEQIDFFRQKLNLPTEHWNDIWRDAHDRAFVVAGATKTDFVITSYSIHYTKLYDATKARHEAYKYASFITAVKQHQIMIGMSEEDLKKSWGYPDHINETVTENGKREQWVYISESGRNYVYVENGVITAWN